MEEAMHRFVRLLRTEGMRVGVSEAVDAMVASAQPGLLADREVLRCALRVCLVKDRRDRGTFDRVFDRFFRLLPVRPSDDHGHSHAHDDLSDDGELDQFALSDQPSELPQQGHSHGKPKDMREFFKPEDMAQQYNLHQEANTLDMASLTDEIVLSDDAASSLSEAARIQLSTSRLHNPGRPGDFARDGGLHLDVELTVAQEAALFDWLDSVRLAPDGLDPAELLAARSALAGLLAGLPEKLRSHLEKLLAMDAEKESPEIRTSRRERVDEADRAELEQQVRRLLHSLHGAPRSRRKVSARGSVDGRRTMRSNLKYDGVPFRPVTVAKVADRPRLLVLADVSLSVRAVARFTLHLVHGLQTQAGQVRTFAFVREPVEITDLFAEHPLEEALGLVFAGLPEGGVLDVDADSDYGTAFSSFLEEYGSSVNRRTTLIVLGDGRGNGKDPGLRAFEELTRRARETVWLTPEPRFSWGLGSCDLPRYAPLCSRVQVVRDVAGLEHVATSLRGLAT